MTSVCAEAAKVSQDDIVLLEKKEAIAPGLEKNFFSMGPKKFSLVLPSDWKTAFDLFGTPLMALGPRLKETRPVLMVIPLKGKNLNFDKKSLVSFKKFYRKGRREWIKEQVDAQALEFYPENFVDIKGVSSDIGAGYKYKLGKKTFTEYTYYFTCKTHFYHLKSLIDESSSSYKEDLENIIGSFRCQR